MKHVCSALLLLMATQVAAQAPPVGFAIRFGDASMNGAYRVGVDALGNAYTCGYYSGTLTIGPETVTTAGSRDVYVAKHDAQGNGVWVRSYGYIGGEGGMNTITVDAEGNSYVALQWFLQLTVGDTTYISNNGSRDICVLKLNADGEVQWSTVFGGTQDDTVHEIQLDANGDLFVAGTWAQDLTVAGDTINGTGTNAFLMKLDAAGTPLWTRVLSSTGGSMAYALAVDASGHCTITGFADGTVNTGAHTFSTDQGQNAFLIKYDGSGTDLWALNAVPATGYSYGTGLAADAEGNLYMTGSFNTQIQIGADTFTANNTSTYLDGFLAKFTSDGAPIWAYSFGGNSSDAGRDVEVDTEGNPHFIGIFRGDIFIGPISIGSAGQNDVFVTKLDPAGTFIWMTRIGGTGVDVGNDLAMHTNNDVYVTGFFHEPMTVGNNLLTPAGFEDAFLVKYDIDLANGVPTLGLSNGSSLTGQFNLLGQPVDGSYPGPRIIRYSDGRAVRMMTWPH